MRDHSNGCIDDRAGIRRHHPRDLDIHVTSIQRELPPPESTTALDGLLFQGDSLADTFEKLAKSIAEAALQAALLGTGPLAGLFGTAGSTGGVGGILGNILSGFASGGYTGDGAANRPAGVVHGGEYVFSKAATSKIGVGNLDALHSGLKGYAAGGFVGPAPLRPSRGV